MLRFAAIVFLTLFCMKARAQSYRGISVLSDSLCWVSGSKGTVLRTMDGGQHWDTLSPKGFSTKEFRDIHAFSSMEAVVMSSGDSAVVLKTNDGGQSWDLVHANNRPGVFYDAMDFHEGMGVIIGDPFKVGDSLRFDFLFTADTGKTWFSLPKHSPQPIPGEALFAASGTNIFFVKIENAAFFFPLFITGGMRSMLYYGNAEPVELPFASCATCGAYGMALGMNDDKVIVGGDYLKPDIGEGSAVYYDAGTRSYKLSKVPPRGYRSGVAVSPDYTVWVCTGINGCDMSLDNGATWMPLSLPGFNTLAFSNNYLWLAGDKGAVMRVAVEE